MPRTARIATAVVIIVLSFAPPSRAQTTQPAADVPLTAQRKLTTNTQLPRAPHRVTAPSDTGAFLIETDNLTLDLNGAALIGAPESTPADQYTGRAIVVRNAKHVTIQNGAIRGFKIAVYAENAPGLTIDNLDLSRNYRQHLKSTPQREHKDDWLWPAMNDNHEWLRYGAGVYLLQCDRAAVRNCRARNGQNGVCLDRCNEVTVEKNDFCFLSGWGVALWRSCRNRVLANRLDYCVRGYSHGVYNRGQDSAGILVYEQSSDNLFAFNSATHCGDGFFLYAGHETLKQTGTGGSNRNLVFGNDFSHAVMHGIEATFSTDNAFLHNTLLGCENGVWAGYSKRTRIARNAVTACTTGIAIEHGEDNRLDRNHIVACKQAIHLWWDEDPSLRQFPVIAQGGGAARNEAVTDNHLWDCDTGILLDRALDVVIDRNDLVHCATPLRILKRTTVRSLRDNNITGGGGITVTSDSRVIAERNFIDSCVSLPQAIDWRSPRNQPNDDVWRTAECPVGDDIYEYARALEIPVAKTNLWELGNKLNSSQSKDRINHRYPPGKEHIVITHWGPLGPEPLPDDALIEVFSAGNETAIRVNQVDTRFIARIVSGDVEATPSTGQTPATVRIRPRPGATGVLPYVVEICGSLLRDTLEGRLIATNWQVQYHAWPDAADPRQGDDHWKKIIATTPLKTETRAAIDFNWGVGRPDPAVPLDKFALVATTRLRLPAGRWKFKTISDDGVRVYLDGKRIIDNWTWHVPAEDSAIVDLPVPTPASAPACARFAPTSASAQTVPPPDSAPRIPMPTTAPAQLESSPPAADHDIRIEYWDLTGGAQLNFTLEPA